MQVHWSTVLVGLMEQAVHRVIIRAALTHSYQPTQTLQTQQVEDLN
jgi:hypothetical protein